MIPGGWKKKGGSVEKSSQTEEKKKQYGGSGEIDTIYRRFDIYLWHNKISTRNHKNR